MFIPLVPAMVFPEPEKVMDAVVEETVPLLVTLPATDQLTSARVHVPPFLTTTSVRLFPPAPEVVSFNVPPVPTVTIPLQVSTELEESSCALLLMFRAVPTVTLPPIV